MTEANDLHKSLNIHFVSTYNFVFITVSATINFVPMCLFSDTDINN